MTTDGDPVANQWRNYYRDECRGAITTLVEEYPKNRSIYVDILNVHRHEPELDRIILRDPDHAIQVAEDSLVNLHTRF